MGILVFFMTKCDLVDEIAEGETFRFYLGDNGGKDQYPGQEEFRAIGRENAASD